jgi:hypothetical protein
VPQEFGGRSKRSEKKLWHKKIAEIHKQYYYLKITMT